MQTLVASYEAYEDLMKKSQEGKDFYTDLEGKVAKLLERARAACQASEAQRQQLLERWVGRGSSSSSEGPHSPMPGILSGRSRALLWCWQPGISLPRVAGCPGNGAWIKRNSHTRAVPAVTTNIKRVQTPPLEHTKK